MRTALARLVMVLVALAGLLTTAVQPATANTTVLVSTFVGDMYITGGGFGDPCTPYGTTSNCVPDTTTTIKAGPKGLPTINTTVNNGNTRGFGFSSTLCLAGGVSVEVGKVPVASPLCSLAAAGAITGFCGLASATGTGAFQMPRLETFGYQTYFFTWKLSWGGVTHEVSHLTLYGSVTKSTGGAAGWVMGEIDLYPDPPFNAGGGSCTNKTATHYTVNAEMVFKIQDLI